MSATPARGPRTERVFAVLNRDPLDAPHQLRTDLVVSGVVGALGAGLAVVVPDDGLALDALGWAMLAAVSVALAWRRRHPVAVLLMMVALVAPYHALDYSHSATTPAMMVALYTVAVTGPPLRAALLGVGIICLTLTVMFLVDIDLGLKMLRTSGWIIAVVVIGMDVRVYRKYIAAVVERAERAERTREEEAARRVAEERLRIARDLHDLLAHSITLIGVQTSVASHILSVDPDRLDRAAISQALDGISDTCRDARSELRTTLEVLRAGGAGEDGEGAWGGALPDLAALSGLVESARTAGAEAELTVRVEGVRVPPVAEAAAYRIVQESLTNAVRHAGPAPRVRVRVETHGGALHVSVTDNGGAPGGKGAPADPGYGIVGMRERARSVGGTLEAGQYDGGFRVSAVLPLGERGERPEAEPRHAVPRAGDERQSGSTPLPGIPPRTPPTASPSDGAHAVPAAGTAPAESAGPATPAEPAVSAESPDPVGSAGPAGSAAPAGQAAADGPIGPSAPAAGTAPAEPAGPAAPAGPRGPAESAASTRPTTRRESHP